LGFAINSETPFYLARCDSRDDVRLRLRTGLPVKRFSAVHRDAVIRVYDEAGNVIETQEQSGDFKEWRGIVSIFQPFLASLLPLK
jgi:hypothetical protein